VVPLRVGGGTRLKVLEAMSMSKGIVSTSMGCEGIDITPEQELLIADEPLSFAKKTVSLMRSRERRRELGLAARRLVEDRYDWQHIASLMERVYES
jgi:glycosyltransferase involved in cell wall biosynthesis